MSNGNDAISWRDRIRELVAAGTVIVAVGAGAGLADTSGTAEFEAIRVAAFNIQVFGKTKAGKSEVMDVLARTAQEFDLVVVQEIRDRTESVADLFLERINRDSDLPYAMVEGPRVGRTSAKEQYVIYYTPATVQFVDSFTVPDPEDRFEREPLVTRFQSGQFDFRLIAAHIDPDDVDRELAALSEAAAARPRRAPWPAGSRPAAAARPGASPRWPS